MRMVLEALNEIEYMRKTKEYQYSYNQISFHKLNESKVDQTAYLLFKNSRYRLGLIVGIEGKTMYCPYSAPFGIFEKLHEKVKISEIQESIACLMEYARERGVEKIYFKLPPLFYDEDFISKVSNVLYTNAFQLVSYDLNYHISLDKDLVENYQNRIAKNARKNLNIAEKSGLSIRRCESESEKLAAYNIIQINRKTKGYPLHMSWEQVKKTIEFMEHDFFLVNDGTLDIAAAVNFHVNQEVVQVIYWGDIPGVTEKKPINFLSHELMKYYYETNKKILDIGPSTVYSIPNNGLCDFKESIGCQTSPKLTFIADFSQEKIERMF